MQCMQCKTELIGRKKGFCSDKCRMRHKRAKVEPEPERAKVEQPKPERVLTQTMLNKLPIGVVYPGGQPDEHTRARTADQLQWDIGCRVNWPASPEYAEAVYRLLTMTVDELEVVSQWIPTWKLKYQGMKAVV